MFYLPVLPSFLPSLPPSLPPWCGRYSSFCLVVLFSIALLGDATLPKLLLQVITIGYVKTYICLLLFILEERGAP